MCVRGCDGGRRVARDLLDGRGHAATDDEPRQRGMFRLGLCVAKRELVVRERAPSAQRDIRSPQFGQQCRCSGLHADCGKKWIRHDAHLQIVVFTVVFSSLDDVHDVVDVLLKLGETEANLALQRWKSVQQERAVKRV
jgi:hypothetical protein